jgi:hypothetical protein
MSNEEILILSVDFRGIDPGVPFSPSVLRHQPSIPLHCDSRMSFENPLANFFSGESDTKTDVATCNHCPFEHSFCCLNLDAGNE